MAIKAAKVWVERMALAAAVAMILSITVFARAEPVPGVARQSVFTLSAR